MTLAAGTRLGSHEIQSSIGVAAECARLHMILRRRNSWTGVADTRHDGQPRGC